MKLHHIGIVVADLSEAIIYYRDIFGLSVIREAVKDHIQKVEVVFFETGAGNDLMLELIRPITEDSPVRKFLEKGGGVHHFGFEVDEIHEAIKEMREKGALILGDPLPGKGHYDKLTAWLFTKKKELVELVEK